MLPARPRRGTAADRVYTAFVPRRSKLRRPSDRWETVSRWVALVILLLLVPLVLQLGNARTQQVRDQAALVRATSHEVRATVVAVSAQPSGEGAGGDHMLTVSWTEPDGSVHVAPTIAYDAAPPVGAPYPLWVDQQSRQVAPPSTERDAVLQGYVAEVAAVTGSLLVLLSGLGLVRCLLDRYRLRQWDEDWLAFRRRRDRGAAG